MVRCISVRQPYASAIINGQKSFEGRRFYISPGRLYIHAGLKSHEHYPDLDLKKYKTGAIIGYVDVVAAEKVSLEEFQLLYKGMIFNKVELSSNAPCYKWVLRNPVSIPSIPFKGRQGVFDIPEVV